MKAIILAAGKGSRLYPVTLKKPKGLLEIGNETILDRLIRQFKANGIEDVLLVVGYQKECLFEHFGKSIRYREYPDFEDTNNLYTLWSIRDELNDDVIISFADLIVHDSIIDELVKSKDDIMMVVDTSRVLEGTMRVAVNDVNLVSITTTTIEDASGNFIGISKLNKEGCKMLADEMSLMIGGYQDAYYTLAIDRLVRNGVNVGYYDAKDYIWREIDTKDEYDEVIQNYKYFS